MALELRTEICTNIIIKLKNDIIKILSIIMYIEYIKAATGTPVTVCDCKKIYVFIYHAAGEVCAVRYG